MIEPQWTPDCQGKWDYDCDIVQLSCRYWPRGGSWTMFDTATGVMQESKDRPHIPPHAACHVLIGDDQVACADFTGETEQEVKAKVEAWAKEAMSRVMKAVRAEFAVGEKGANDG